MKRFLFPSIFFFTILLFSFTSNVNAETYVVEPSSFDYVTSTEFNSLKSFSDTYLQQNNTYNFYRIWRNGSTGVYYSYISKVNTSNTCTFSYQSANSRFNCYQSLSSSPSTQVYKYENGNVVFSNQGQYTALNVNVNISSGVANFNNLLYIGRSFDTPVNFYISNSSFTLYIDSNNSYEVSANGFFPTLYDIYNSYTPQDDNLLLTNFYTLVINKLQLVTEYFSSNYVYLSIFAIFILIFFLYLIKRRLF